MNKTASQIADIVLAKHANILQRGAASAAQSLGSAAQQSIAKATANQGPIKARIGKLFDKVVG